MFVGWRLKDEVLASHTDSDGFQRDEALEDPRAAKRYRVVQGLEPRHQARLPMRHLGHVVRLGERQIGEARWETWVNAATVPTDGSRA